MTVEELESKLEKTAWFTSLGTYVTDGVAVGLPDLDAWLSDEQLTDTELERVARDMDWLPSESALPDPFETVERSSSLDAFQREQVLAVYKTALRSLRDAPVGGKLKSGPHDFSEAAKTSAAHAARRAAIELIRDGVPGHWNLIVDLYARGHWPCGLLPDGRLVVL